MNRHSIRNSKVKKTRFLIKLIQINLFLCITKIVIFTSECLNIFFNRITHSFIQRDLSSLSRPRHGCRPLIKLTTRQNSPSQGTSSGSVWTRDKEPAQKIDEKKASREDEESLMRANKHKGTNTCLRSVLQQEDITVLFSFPKIPSMFDERLELLCRCDTSVKLTRLPATSMKIPICTYEVNVLENCRASYITENSRARTHTHTHTRFSLSFYNS